MRASRFGIFYQKGVLVVVSILGLLRFRSLFSVSLFLCFSVSLFLCFSVSLFLYFSVSLFLCFSVSLFLCFSVSLFLCFSVSLFLCFSVSLFLCFSFSLSVFQISFLTAFPTTRLRLRKKKTYIRSPLAKRRDRLHDVRVLLAAHLGVLFADLGESVGVAGQEGDCQD